MRVQKHEVGGPGLLEHGADQLGGDGYPIPIFLVTLAVEEEGSDHHNVGSGGQPEIKNKTNLTIGAWLSW